MYDNLVDYLGYWTLLCLPSEWNETGGHYVFSFVRPSVCAHSVPVVWMGGMMLRNVWHTLPTVHNSNLMSSLMCVHY